MKETEMCQFSQMSVSVSITYQTSERPKLLHVLTIQLQTLVPINTDGLRPSQMLAVLEHNSTRHYGNMM